VAPNQAVGHSEEVAPVLNDGSLVLSTDWGYRSAADVMSLHQRLGTQTFHLRAMGLAVLVDFKLRLIKRGRHSIVLAQVCFERWLMLCNYPERGQTGFQVDGT